MEGITTRNAIRPMEKYRDCVIRRTVSTSRTSHFARSPNSASSERDFMTVLLDAPISVSVGCQFHSQVGQIWRCLGDGGSVCSRYVTAHAAIQSPTSVRIHAKFRNPTTTRNARSIRKSNTTFIIWTMFDFYNFLQRIKKMWVQSRINFYNFLSLSCSLVSIRIL